MIKVKQAQFIKGIRGTDPILDDPQLQVAFIGRSNVGKSSTINYLLERKSLVKTSSKPGKTTEINFFDVRIEQDEQDYDYRFVDLPGYGYARLSEDAREKLRKMILWYILYAEVSARVFVLVLDAQVGLTDFDQEILNILAEHKQQVMVLLNKADKCTQSVYAKQLNSLRAIAVEPLRFSSHKRIGRDNFFEILRSCTTKKA